MRRTIDGFEFSTNGLKLMMILFTIVGGIFTLGVSYATARSALNEKADVATVLQIREALLIDSLKEDARSNQLRRIDAKLDSISARITQLVCPPRIPACR